MNRKMREILAIEGNQLILIHADCAHLDRVRAGTGVTFGDYAQYISPG